MISLLSFPGAAKRFLCDVQGAHLEPYRNLNITDNKAAPLMQASCSRSLVESLVKQVDLKKRVEQWLCQTAIVKAEKSNRLDSPKPLSPYLALLVKS